MAYREWTDEEAERLHSLVIQYPFGAVQWSKVSEAMGRTSKSCDKKWGRISGRSPDKPRPGRHDLPRNYLGTGQVPVPESCVAERDRRASLEPRDLTAGLMGDPLPGYSALERWMR